MKENIYSFVNNFSDLELQTLFKHYDCGSYDHLLLFPRKHYSIESKRSALRNYLLLFTGANLPDDISVDGNPIEDERTETLRNIIDKNNTQELIATLCNDQFFEEPLMNILNQNS